jgi:hypothetical protein
MGHDDPRPRWRRIHGLSPEGKASIDGRVIEDNQEQPLNYFPFFRPLGLPRSTPTLLPPQTLLNHFFFGGELCFKRRSGLFVKQPELVVR